MPVDIFMQELVSIPNGFSSSLQLLDRREYINSILYYQAFYDKIFHYLAGKVEICLNLTGQFLNA